MADPAPEPTDERGLNKAQKFVRLVELMQRKGGVGAAEAMARFDLDDRTLRRYLSDLRELGMPLHDEGRGIGRRLWLSPSYGRQSVQVSLLELVSLRFGRLLFDFLAGTGFAHDMDEALETLSTLALDSPGIDLAHDLDRKFLAVPEHRKDHRGDADLIEEVLSALLYQNPATAHYARVLGPTRAYTLHPYTLATFRQGLYLFAMDLDEGKVKTFAIDRFRHFERQRGEHFEYPEDYHPSEVVRDAFGIIGGPVEDVVLRFNRRQSPYIRERAWHRTQVVEPDDDGGVILRMRVGVAHELVSWVLGFGPDVVVEAPASLAEHVRRLHVEAAEGLARPGRRRAG